MKSYWKSQVCGNPLCFLVFVLKRLLSGYYTQGNLPAYTKFFTGRNVLDTHQLRRPFSMNTTVSSHLLESPVQSCMKASREEPNHSKDWTPGRLQQVPGHRARSGCSGVWADYMLLPGFTEHQWKQGGRKPSSEFFFQSHFVSQLVSLRTSSHYHEARAGGMTTSQA